MSADQIELLAADIVTKLAVRGETVAVAESCTGGGVLAALTSIPGSSEVVWGGIVSYANDAKSVLLDVEAPLINAVGAVSKEVAKAMAWGMRTRSGADRTVAVTGIAGPGGGTKEKPVGTVWIAWYGPEIGITAERCHFDGDRTAVRRLAVAEALTGLRRQLDR